MEGIGPVSPYPSPYRPIVFNLKTDSTVDTKQIFAQLGKQSESQIRFQRIDISVLNGTAAGTMTQANVQLDRDYNRIIGIGYFEIADGGIPDQYNVGAKTNRSQWIDPININAWDANANVGPADKYYPVNIPYGSGDTFYVQVENEALLTADLEGQMVLILKRDLDEIPRT